ncbi:unnamed protein product [Brassicogethes aeneus]|uniref:Uncharacterized protein n=1 Tax=Brassicogethes aeneus TaxID=1431903 RepID=A0A9P0FNQ2_BRAAE|nr:unnamed protein product [Brassicogethes aeneus]
MHLFHQPVYAQFMLHPIHSTSKCPMSNIPEDELEISQNSQVFQKLNDLSAVAKTLDRFGVSNRAGAAIVSATLQTVGLISEDNLSNVVDSRNKIRRAREKQRNSLADVHLLSENGNFGLYFDGRKDKTLTMVDSRKKFILEEHISLVKEPGSEYMGHGCLQFKHIDWHKLIVVGSDGTVVNTGRKGGTIRYLEIKLKRPRPDKYTIATAGRCNGVFVICMRTSFRCVICSSFSMVLLVDLEAVQDL